MQWPDILSAGVMIRGVMLESDMSSIGSVRRTAEPVSVAAKSESLKQPPWLWWRQLHRKFLSCWWLEVIF